MWNEEQRPFNPAMPPAIGAGEARFLVDAQEPSAGPVETHPEYPLERTCVHLYEPFQLKFARHAQQLLSVSCELSYDSGHHGLTLRAEVESELELAATILRNFYGAQVRIGPVKVRCHHGAGVEEPFMGLRVRCESDRLEAVTHDLLARGGVIVSTELLRGVALLRAVAPLRNLLGYGKSLAHIAGNSARQVMWLSHYAPVQATDSVARESSASGSKVLQLRKLGTPSVGAATRYEESG
jgi:hypothetical protein